MPRTVNSSGAREGSGRQLQHSATAGVEPWLGKKRHRAAAGSAAAAAATEAATEAEAEAAAEVGAPASGTSAALGVSSIRSFAGIPLVPAAAAAACDGSAAPI